MSKVWKFPTINMELILSNCKKDENGCLNWQGKTLKGFPQYGSQAKNLRRWVWEQFHPEIVGNDRIYNRCHNRLCLNHRHMYIDIPAKWYEKPEYPARTGEENNNHTLTEEDVVTIRDMRRNGSSVRYLVEKYGITKQQIYRIIKREAWSHL